jgi:hypothetical protein
MSLSNDSQTSVAEILAGAQAKVEQLQTVKPFLIDLSLRENPVGARVGQTLADKLQILPKIREFGFQNILLGTLDYSLPDELEVDDDFMMYLRDHGVDMTGGFAFTAVGSRWPTPGGGRSAPPGSRGCSASYRRRGC